MALNIVAVDVLAVALCVLFIYWRKRKGSDGTRLYPPGPKALPLLGNILDMPSSYQYLTFAKWAERWGLWRISGYFDCMD